MSKRVSSKHTIKVDKGSEIEMTKEGLIVRNNKVIKRGGNDFIYPTHDQVAWHEDLYSKQWERWERQQNDRFSILVQAMTRDAMDQLTCLGYCVHELQDEDGKLVFGSWEKPLIDPPITFRDHDYAMNNGNTISFSVMAPEEVSMAQSAAFIPNTKKQFT